jgi:hypothetical protein
MFYFRPILEHRIAKLNEEIEILVGTTKVIFPAIAQAFAVRETFLLKIRGLWG